MKHFFTSVIILSHPLSIGEGNLKGILSQISTLFLLSVSIITTVAVTEQPQPLPTISFFSHEIYLDEQTRNFTVSVKLENLQASHKLGGVSVRLEYDSTLLSFVGDMPGDFLEDFTRYFIIDMDSPYIWLMNLPFTSFPEGNGTIWMCSFTMPVLVHTSIRLIGEAVDFEGNVLIQNSTDYCHLIVAEQPTISLFPSEIYIDEHTGKFTVSVNLENVQASHRLVAVEMRLQYDARAISFIDLIDGDFLKDFEKFSITETGMDSMPIIMLMLMPPYDRFPEGSGTILVCSFAVHVLAHTTIYLFSDAGDFEGGLLVRNATNFCSVIVTWNRADLDFNGEVDILDLSVFAKAFASRPGHYRWNTNVDIDENQMIDIRDAVKIAVHFGEKRTIPLLSVD